MPQLNNARENNRVLKWEEQESGNERVSKTNSTTAMKAISHFQF